VTAAEILRTYTPEKFADLMNRLRLGQYIQGEMSVEKAEQLLGTLTACELADLIETAIEWTPTKMTWDKRLDALWSVEAGGYKTKTPNEDRTVRTAQETRKLLGQRKPRGRPRSRRSAG
jgi:hypothetical protein